jgi:hypothetical protein
MLREDVVQAVSDGRFSIYTIDSIDDALELLTGVPAGAKQADGSYPAETINGRVMARLHAMTEKLRALDVHYWPDFPAAEIGRMAAPVEAEGR